MIDWIGCQLAEEYQAWPAGYDYVLVEPKLDGYRLSVLFDDEGKISYHCRDAESPQWAENLEHITVELQQLGLKNWMLDGEIMAGNWGETSKLVRRKRSIMSEDIKERIRREVKLNLFDAVDMNVGRRMMVKPAARRKQLAAVVDSQSARRGHLEGFMEILVSSMLAPRAVRIAPQMAVRSHKELELMYQQYLAQGYEGVMVKLPDAPYVFDRSPYWLKMKPVKTVDMIVIGIEEGLGKHAGRLGALLCKDPLGQLVSVGGGFTDEQRGEFWRMRETGAHLGLKIEVRMQDDKVATARHPRFLRIRDDSKSAGG